MLSISLLFPGGVGCEPLADESFLMLGGCHPGYLGFGDRFICNRERDTTGQLIGDIDQVIGIVTELVDGTIDWAEACKRLPAYDGVQAVDA